MVLWDVDTHKMYITPFDEGSGTSIVFGRNNQEGYRSVFEKCAKESKVIVDIRAHNGYHALMFAKIVGDEGTIYAFEPCSHNFSLLVKNIKLNGYKNIFPVKMAVYDKVGTARLYLFISSEGHSLQVKRSRHIVIETTSLDKFFEDKGYRVDFIRMNVEGSEPKVLDGMHKILSLNPHLIIATEYNEADLIASGCSPEKFLDKIRDLGLNIYCIDEYTGVLYHISGYSVPLNSLGLAYLLLTKDSSQLRKLGLTVTGYNIAELSRRGVERC